jgi:hypothetical protein
MGLGFWPMSAKDCNAATVNLTSVKLRFTHTSTSGKLSLDQVGVRLEQRLLQARESIPNGALPPPAAPSGYRGSN